MGLSTRSSPASPTGQIDTLFVWHQTHEHHTYCHHRQNKRSNWVHWSFQPHVDHEAIWFQHFVVTHLLVWAKTDLLAEFCTLEVFQRSNVSTWDHIDCNDCLDCRPVIRSNYLTDWGSWWLDLSVQLNLQSGSNECVERVEECTIVGSGQLFESVSSRWV